MHIVSLAELDLGAIAWSKPEPDEAPHEPDQLLTITEVTRPLRVSRTMIYWLIQQGELQPLRIGRAVRFRVVDVHNYIRLCTVLHDKRAGRKHEQS